MLWDSYVIHGDRQIFPKQDRRNGIQSGTKTNQTALTDQENLQFKLPHMKIPAIWQMFYLLFPTPAQETLAWPPAPKTERIRSSLGFTVKNKAAFSVVSSIRSWRTLDAIFWSRKHPEVPLWVFFGHPKHPLDHDIRKILVQSFHFRPSMKGNYLSRHLMVTQRN